MKGGTHPFFYHKGTKTQSLRKSLCDSFVALWLIFSDVCKAEPAIFLPQSHEGTTFHEISLGLCGGTGHFFCHEDTKTQSFTKSLCGFVADLFGCVKSGTGHFFCHEATKAQSQ
ncbi:hypothetical protein [Desulfonema magnum]|uniref:hypothetical protein n=1 Tax=Desulfonema magnum TaxID=45655 RepID=UPI001A9C0BC6|nr:hypothetical protein [Desulfonema magnum]